MPKRGELSDIEWLQGPQRELTQAVRGLYMLLVGKQLGTRGVADRCRSSKSAFSALLNGKTKRPSLTTLRMLHELAEREVGAEALPVSMSQVERLHGALLAADEVQDQQPCANCPASRAQAAPLLAAAPSTNGQPADRPVRTSGLDTRLPVPSPKGDRQPIVVREWLGMDDLVARLVADQVADAAGILRYMGLAATPPETAAAINSCHRRGLAEAANAIIVYAAQRTDHEVMRIAKVLLDGADPDGAAELLGRRLTA
ncbi:hypothetical protein AB0M46_41390 [Dactylosporangium sp. NPDC051485]|uniref:hypothetical protein n=1 Tax=Dactylosporangium sp. NPDC051485 TaxID=3154846 RepID=UPI00341F8C9F